ncbi:MAG: hypothetical protein EU548_07125 [Promethearchaeota archaeon]|nr:MAG: hypothetical protein EU548_07125 [Candidatus Lokiarchaeota archaeon]
MVNLKEYIEFEKGTLPLIISVPHGGTLECRSIPKRIEGIMGIDKATYELSHDLINHIKNKSERLPSYIISKVRRSKIDLNRIETEAFNSNSALANKIYQLYHRKIKEFISDNLKTFKYSLLIDIHGFEKDKRPPGYRDVELILGTNNLASLFSKPVPTKDRDKNIRGKIIKKFLNLDIPIAPGRLRRKEYVLTGGYIIKQYGNSKIPGSKSIQIEFSDRIRLYDGDLKRKVLEALSEVLLDEIL